MRSAVHHHSVAQDRRRSDGLCKVPSLSAPFTRLQPWEGDCTMVLPVTTLSTREAGLRARGAAARRAIWRLAASCVDVKHDSLTTCFTPSPV